MTGCSCRATQRWRDSHVYLHYSQHVPEVYIKKQLPQTSGLSNWRSVHPLKIIKPVPSRTYLHEVAPPASRSSLAITPSKERRLTWDIGNLVCAFIYCRFIMSNLAECFYGNGPSRSIRCAEKNRLPHNLNSTDFNLIIQIAWSCIAMARTETDQ